MSTWTPQQITTLFNGIGLVVFLLGVFIVGCIALWRIFDDD